MNIFLLLLKIVFLAMGIAYGFCCVARVIRRLNVSNGQVLLMAIGLSVFIGLQWLM